MTTTTAERKREMVNADEIRREVRAAGSHFFDEGAMRFFSSRLARTGWKVRDGRGGAFFVLVTSERFESYSAEVPDGPRLYSVRVWRVFDWSRQHHELASMMGEQFQEYETGAEAHRSAEQVARMLESAWFACEPCSLEKRFIQVEGERCPRCASEDVRPVVPALM
jgi:predicted Zn-ribbon and HTH transcriptional regulator